MGLSSGALLLFGLFIFPVEPELLCFSKLPPARGPLTSLSFIFREGSSPFEFDPRFYCFFDVGLVVNECKFCGLNMAACDVGAKY